MSSKCKGSPEKGAHTINNQEYKIVLLVNSALGKFTQTE